MMEQYPVIPFSFFDAKGVDLSNFVVGEIVLQSLPIPEGHVGIIKDNDTVFLSSNTGKLDFAIKRASGGISTFRQGIFSDDSGFINKILHAGDRVLIILNTVGADVLDIIWDGEIRQLRKIVSEKFETPDSFGDDEF